MMSIIASASRDASLPLQPKRTIQFTVDEGTWISLDVSPDGQTIVFDLLGVLYTMPVGGGKATAITSGLEFDAQPRYAPDGRSLVFTSDRDGWVNVWVMSIEGRQYRQITTFRWSEVATALVMSPEWTPDGAAIVVSERTSGGGVRLSEYPVTGGTPKLLTAVSDAEIKRKKEFLGPAFGGDARFVYAATKSTGGEDAYWQIARIDRRSRSSQLVTSPMTGRSAMRPVLSPNGRYLVFSAPSDNDTGLRIRDLETDGEWWLARHAQKSVAAFSRDSRDLVPGSSFTPDGQEFVTAFDGKIWRIDLRTGNGRIIPFSATVSRAVGPLVRFEYPISDDHVIIHAIRDPQISPDGTRVAFSALDRLWMADVPPRDRPSAASSFQSKGNEASAIDRSLLSTDTIVPRRLTAERVGEFFPTWSPDGRYVTYATWTDSEAGALKRVRVDGTHAAERLTSEAGLYMKPVYTSDGKEIVAVRGFADTLRTAASDWTPPGAGALQLIVLPSSGGAVRALAPYRIPDLPVFYWKGPAFVYNRPHVSRRGDAVWMYDQERGLQSVALDVFDRSRLANEAHVTFSETNRPKATELLISPSERFALGLTWKTNQPYLVVAADSNSAKTPSAESRVVRLREHSADFVGWTADERPYFSAGNVLFIADVPATASIEPPTFRRLTIDLKVPRDNPTGAILFRGGRLVTMRGHEVIERGDLLVQNGRIEAVGQQGTIIAPDGARIVDANGTTILPGYVDVHGHVGARISYGTHMSQEPRLLIELASGVTTIRDPLGYGVDLMAYGELAAIGELVAPRLFTMSSGVWPEYFGDGSNQELAQTREVLKLWSDYYHSETIKQYLAGGRRTRQLVAMAARELSLTPTNEGFTDTAMELTMAIDGYGAIEHHMPATPQFNDIVQLFVRTRVIQTPTLGLALLWRPLLRHEDVWSDAKLRRFFPPTGIADERKLITETVTLMPPDDAASVRELAEPAAKIMAAGGCVAMGSHGNISGVGVHYELWLLARGGMLPYDVLRAATICGAEAIGHERDFGSLESGKLADLQVLDKNPLNDITYTRSIRYVMKGGRLYDANTLDEIWPQHRSLEPQWWWPRTPSN